MCVCVCACRPCCDLVLICGDADQEDEILRTKKEELELSVEHHQLKKEQQQQQHRYNEQLKSMDATVEARSQQEVLARRTHVAQKQHGLAAIATTATGSPSSTVSCNVAPGFGQIVLPQSSSSSSSLSFFTTATW